jgi:hypothetical protein
MFALEVLLVGHSYQNLSELESTDVLVISCILFVVFQKLSIRVLENHIQIISAQGDLL